MRSAQLAVDRVVVNVRAARAASGLDAAGNEVDHFVELRALEIGERSRAPHERVELVGSPLARTALRDDLLGEDVERALRRVDGVEGAGAHRDEQRHTFDELVAR